MRKLFALTILALLCVLSINPARAAYRSSNAPVAASAGVFTGSAPAGLTTGDFLWAIISQADNSAQTITATGWTDQTAAASTAGLNGHRFRLLTKIATGSDSFVFTSSDTVSGGLMIVGAHSGRDTTTPLAVTPVATSNSSSNTSPVSMAATGLTAAVNDDMLVAYALDNASLFETWTNTGPGSYTERQDAGDGTNNTLAVYTLDNVSAGATGTLTGTATRTSGSGNSGWMAMVVSIKASAGGGGGSSIVIKRRRR